MEKNERNDERDKLIDDIARIETPGFKATKVELPKADLQKIEYTPPTDEELSRVAQAELEESRSKNIAALKQNAQDSERALHQTRADTETARDKQTAELSQDYAAAVRALDSDAIRRGLSRSSIAVSERAELEKQYLSSNAEIAAVYGKKLSDIDAEISSLQPKLRAALNDFNLSYAAKLSSRLTELKAERDKKTQDIIKYNNDVEERRAKSEIDRAKAQSTLFSQALSQERTQSYLKGLPSDKQYEIYNAVYDKMDAFLGSLTTRQAFLEIHNHTLYREHLPNDLYNKLLSKYGRQGI